MKIEMNIRIDGLNTWSRRMQVQFWNVVQVLADKSIQFASRFSPSTISKSNFTHFGHEVGTLSTFTLINVQLSQDLFSQRLGTGVILDAER